MGVTFPVGGSKDHLHIKGFKPKGAGDLAEDLPVPLAHKEIHRELPILGEDNFCLEYTWQCKSFIGTFVEGSGLGDAENSEHQPSPAGGTALDWGGPVAEDRS